MNLLRSAAVATALMAPFGLAQAPTLGSTPSLPTLTDSPAPDLRAVGSQLVVDTIENALRQGGVALFDERFQIDSSVSWVFGETVKGELDAVVPLWSKGKHVVFTQPGFVLWNGIEEEGRRDGNLGVVYRTETIKGIVAGASLFYDHDFKIGHSRLGIGVDAQRDGFYGAFNYYHPLSDTEEGREGYVEDALRGMDAGLAVESTLVRVAGNLGYWLFEGDDGAEDDWKFSYGVDAGLRIRPGIFLEGRLEHHDKKASIGQRASVGVAFRFTLPGFEGKSYRDGGKDPDLYRFVEREKRILYEERESGPRVSVVRTGSEAAGGEAIVEGGTVSLDIRLSEALGEDVVLNLIGGGTATYGSDGDWSLSVGDTVCAEVTEDNCQAMVTAGNTEADEDVVVAIRDDLRTGEMPESIILSVEIASAGGTRLTPGAPLVLTIPADLPLPAIELTANTTIAEDGSATLNISLSEGISEDITFSLVAGGDATYGASADWHLDNGTQCDAADGTGTNCQITIAANGRSSMATVTVNDDLTTEEQETFTVAVVVDPASVHLVQAGDSSPLLFTIPANTANTMKFTTTAATVTESGSVRAPAGMNRFTFPELVLTDTLPAGIELTLVITGTSEEGDFGIAAALNQINTNGARYDAATKVWTLPSGITNPILVFEAAPELPSPDTDNEEVIIQITDPNNNLPPGWSIAEPSSITITIIDAG